jgi:hypothetical protein
LPEVAGKLEHTGAVATTGVFRPDADMGLTELEKSFQFGMSIGFALRRRFASRCKFLIAPTRNAA